MVYILSYRHVIVFVKKEALGRLSPQMVTTLRFGSVYGVWIPTPKCLEFLWRLAKSILPTRRNSGIKGITLVMSCPLGNSSLEDTDHRFMRCPASMPVWFSSPLGIHIPDHFYLKSQMMLWLAAPDNRAEQLFCISLLLIWKHRNQKVLFYYFGF
jgi:hypothetical protein